MTDHNQKLFDPSFQTKIEFYDSADQSLLVVDETSPLRGKTPSIMKQPSLDLSTSRSENTTDYKMKSSFSTVDFQKQANQTSGSKIKEIDFASSHMQHITYNKLQNINQNIKKELDRQELKVELYILDYNCQTKAYYPIKTHSQSTGLFVKELADLILSKPKYHVKTYQNIKQVQVLPKSAPKIIKPLVMPLADGSQYAFVFQTVEFARMGDFYISYDRFYIFITNLFIPYTLVQMIKKIVKIQYEDRLCLSNKVYELDHKIVRLHGRQGLLKDINQIVVSSHKYPLSKGNALQAQKKQQLAWYLRDIQTYDILVRLNTLHYYALPLLALLLLFVIRDYKVVFVAHKQQRHIISEIIMALKDALSPIQYCYPTVLVTVSEKHSNYLDAPVPCLVGFWGEERACNKLVKQFSHMLYEDHKLGQTQCVLIDLSSMSVIQKVLSDDQSRQLIQLNQYSKKLDNLGISKLTDSRRNSSLIERLNDYLLNQLINKKGEQSALFKKSFLYQTYKDNTKNSQ